MNVRQELVSRSYVVHNSDYDEQPISRTYQYRKVMNTFISCNRHCGGLFDRNGLFFILLIDNSLAREHALNIKRHISAYLNSCLNLNLFSLGLNEPRN